MMFSDTQRFEPSPSIFHLNSSRAWKLKSDIDKSMDFAFFIPEYPRVNNPEARM
jgi:hypothetical protein